MSSIANLSSAPSAALPSLKLHGHHKKGSALDAAGDSSDTSPSVPATTQQGLFGSLLQALEGAIGVQSTAATGGTASATAPANSATVAGSTSSAGAAATSAQSATALLQGYLRSQAAAQKAAGSNLSVSA
jgi:hypothetical protein